MELLEDYYEILQVNPTASPKVIKAAYRALASEIAPDVNPRPDANERMVKINKAYEVLSDPNKRKNYDLERLTKKGYRPNAYESSPSNVAKPILRVTPKYIRFKELGHLEQKSTYFEIDNIGGPCTHFSILTDQIPKWLEITEVKKLSHQTLPVRVCVKATGQHVGFKYECQIAIRVENKDFKYSDEDSVHIELLMKGPVMQIDNKLLVFSIIPGIIPPATTVTIINVGVGYIEGNLIPREPWLIISPRSVLFQDKQTIQIQINASKLSNNETGHIDIRTNCGNEVIIVKAAVNDPGALSPFTLYFCPKCKKNTIWFNRHNKKYECLKCKRTWKTPEFK